MNAKNGKPATRLKGLQVNEVSFVDRGANAGANILFFKRNYDSILNEGEIPKKDFSKGEVSMTLEELQKQLKELSDTVAKQGETIATVQKERDELKKENDEFQKGKKPPKGKTGDGGGDGGDEPDEDDIGKSDVQKHVDAIKKELDAEYSKKFETMAKQAENAEKVAKAEREARESLEFQKRAESDYPNIGGDSVKKGELLKCISGMPEETQKFAHETLKAANEAIGKFFKETGSTRAANGEAGPLEKLNEMAGELAKKENINFHKAYSMVTQTPEGAKLYAETQS